jgi:hypothetical protein
VKFFLKNLYAQSTVTLFLFKYKVHTNIYECHYEMTRKHNLYTARGTYNVIQIVSYSKHLIVPKSTKCSDCCTCISHSRTFYYKLGSFYIKGHHYNVILTTLKFSASISHCKKVFHTSMCITSFLCMNFQSSNLQLPLNLSPD